MNDTFPTGKIKRTISSTKMITKLGTNQLGYYLKKPFLNKNNKRFLEKKKDMENAKILFNGLSLLRGTALKVAQMLSLESDVIPKSVRKELEKSYNQVPPINRALARKIIISNFNAAPEKVFASFNSKAFAAASLGQVHRAKDHDGNQMAIKVQYPDISKTISNDIRLLEGVLRPMSQYEVIKMALDEIETVLLDETDYEKEAGNIRYFKDHLNLDQVIIPDVYPRFCTKNVLGMSYMKGMVLNKWLQTNPDKKKRTRVAQTLHDIFIRGFYELKQIHADPNPGNFLITDDLKIGLLDFGCVRSFDDKFIKIYQDLINISSGRDKEAYIDVLTRIKLITPQFDTDIRDQMVELFMEMGDWLSQLFEKEEFDFGANPDFMEQGKKIGKKMHRFRKHIHSITPEFIFLDRTRYGLIRMFEKMKVKIKIQNKYEYCTV